jgi:FtsH-binding integral membrane protein
MFLGHYAVAIGAKKAAPKTSLGTLIAAAAFLDLVWPVLVLLGLERVAVAPGATAFTPLDFERYPISHSLLMSAVWGAAFGVVYWLFRRDRRAAAVLAALVVSHWLLDAVVHRPDLPLTLGGDARIGLGLWNSIPATLAVELAMFAVGVWLYVRTTRANDRIGGIGFAAFVLFLLAIYAGAAFGPPPPSASAIAWSDMGQWLVIALAAWVDRHRSLRSA